MTERAIAFDVMGTLFDLRPLHEKLGPGATEAWFERVLHTATSLTLVGEYRPFKEIAASALQTTSAKLGLDADVDEVLGLLGQLPPYEDTVEAVERAAEGATLLTLTNGGAEHTRGLLERAGIADRFAHVLSCDEVQAFKPARAPYELAERTAGAPVTLIAAHAWDVVGARAAGLDAVWVDRLERTWPFPSAEPKKRASNLVEAVELALAFAL